MTIDELSLLDEDPSSESEEDLRGPTNVAQAVVTSTDWTTETILSQLRRKNIELNPRFQRRDAWGDDRKSRFIESLFLGMPTPQLVLAERRDRRGAFLVIDGKQRLLSLRRFAAEPDDEFTALRLRGLEVRDDLNDKTLEDLRVDDDRAADLAEFDNQTIRTVVVRNWPDENFLYRLFHRLNTGSVPLSPQELRQALHPGPFVDYADRRSEESEPLRRTLGLTKPDFRMRDVELLVRFFGFSMYLGDYRGNLKNFLDMTCERLNARWQAHEQEIRELADRLDGAIITTETIFGENAFRRWSGDKYEGRFNRAVFDVMTYYFRSAEIATAADQRRSEVEAAYRRISVDDPDFAEAVQSTTKTLPATYRRLASWGEALGAAIEGTGAAVAVPTLADGRIVP